MRHWHLAGSTALILGLSQAPALAVTPEEVWANWQQAMGSAGLTVVGSAARDGDTLRTGAVTVTIPDPEGGSGSATVSFEGLAFRDRRDGTVEVTLPARYAFAGQGIDGPGSFVATLEETGLSMVASGTAAATRYDIAAEEYALTFGAFTESDGTTPLDMTARVTVAGMAANYAVTPGEGTTGIDSTAAAAETRFELAVKDPQTELDVSFTASLGPVSAVTKGVFVGPELMENMGEALRAGFFVDSTTTVGPVSVTGRFTEYGQAGRIDAALTGASARLALDAARVDYGFGLTGADITVAGPEMPLPEIRTAFGELSFNVLLPVAISETPQTWSAVARLVDLTVADSLWSMFDPGGQLKRDPVTLIVDLKGTGRWTADILDPAVQAQAAPPAELMSMDVAQVLFRALGGEVDATGAFTFDNSDLATFDGFPAPTGKLTTNLTGINALIGTAVSMGFIPEDEVMGVRMGLALLAKPGAGPDQLVSEIEFKDKGLFVNGQRMR